MSLALQTVCAIAAPPEVVWRVLTDFPAVKEWNPVLSIARGTCAEGAMILLLVRLPNRPPLSIPARVLSARPQQELRWKGSIPGLFAGEHFFRLVGQADGTTFLTHGEVFSGLIANLVMTRALQEESRQAYEMMNAGLKARAEALWAAEQTEEPTPTTEDRSNKGTNATANADSNADATADRTCDGTANPAPGGAQ